MNAISFDEGQLAILLHGGGRIVIREGPWMEQPEALFHVMQWRGAGFACNPRNGPFRAWNSHLERRTDFFFDLHPVGSCALVRFRPPAKSDVLRVPSSSEGMMAYTDEEGRAKIRERVLMEFAKGWGEGVDAGRARIEHSNPRVVDDFIQNVCEVFEVEDPEEGWPKTLEAFIEALYERWDKETFSPFLGEGGG